MSTITGETVIASHQKVFLSLPSSPCGKKFRSKPQIARFLGDNADLACFDFSRAGTLGDGTQRRRARDRNPQGTVKRVDSRMMLPAPVRPLSVNPLRASGPVRRTCGVIKLPVMMLSPPSGDMALRDSILGQQGVSEQKQHTMNVVVQSLWERRLKGVNPHDHTSGKDLSRESIIQQVSAAPAPRPDSAPILSNVLSSQSPVLPSLLPSQHYLPGSTISSHISQSSQQLPNRFHINSSNTTPLSGTTPMASSSPLTGTKLLQTHMKNYNSVGSVTPSSSRMKPANQIPLTVTDTDVRLQEQKVQLLRQQLMAAQSSL